MHTFYWGDWHRDHTVGPGLADNISPTGWVTRRGMRFSTHTDAPVAFPDSMRVLDSTVTRRTRSNDILGPDQRVDVMTALKAMTIWPAWHHFEEDRKGSLAVGKLADLVILSDDPRAVDPDTLDQLQVEETVKEGATIFDIRADGGGLHYRPRQDGSDPMADFVRQAAIKAETGGAGSGRLYMAALDRMHSGACVARFLSNVLGSQHI
jgi:Amidohydrolase family